VPVIAEIVGWEVLVPLALIALLFGGGRIPELARSLGRARREFERGRDEESSTTATGEDEPHRS
jgi:sec-independent protein translocase protein TatA